MIFDTKKNTISEARCQCDPQCKLEPLSESPFCKIHQKKCSRVAPLSGAEPIYNPDRFNKYNGIKESHNCFAYAFDYIKLSDKNCTKDSCPIPYPQPGRASGYPKWSKIKGKRCPDLVSRFMGDVPGIKQSTFEEKCPAGMRKIAAVVDADEDYHFFRQDGNNNKNYANWSHKPGATDVTNVDATGRPIYDPQLASKKYKNSGLDYDTFCGYWCIPTLKKMHLGRGGSRKYRTRTRTRKTRTRTRTRKTRTRKII